MATTWNPSDNSDGTLSNGNLTVTFQTSAFTWHSIRSTNSPAKTAGKYHAEATITAEDGTSGWIFGLGDSSANITNWCGSDAHGISIQPLLGGSYSTYLNGSTIAVYPGTVNVGDVIAIETDIDNKLIWWKNVTKATGWTDGVGGFTGNPGAGTGGASYASLVTSGGIMLMGSGFFGGSVDTSTLNPGPTFAGTISSGFSPWNGPAAGAAVTMDAPAVIEFLAGLRREDTAFAEAGAGLYVDRSEFIEFGAAHRNAGSAPVENLANAMRDHVEPAGSTAAAVVDAVATSESLLGSRSEAVSGIETLLKALADSALVEEMLSAQLLDAMIPAETLTTLRIGAAALLEALVTVLLDGNIPDEMLKGATADIVTQIESLQTAPAAIGDSNFMLEWLATPRSDRALMAEFLTLARSDASARDEFLTALREDIVPPTEFKASLRAAGNIPIESLLTAAGNLVSADAVLALELLGSRQRDVRLPIEWSVLPAIMRVSLERLLASPSKRRILGTAGRLRLLKRQ